MSDVKNADYWRGYSDGVASAQKAVDRFLERLKEVDSTWDNLFHTHGARMDKDGNLLVKCAKDTDDADKN